jgi:O-antigen ligase
MGLLLVWLPPLRAGALLLGAALLLVILLRPLAGAILLLLAAPLGALEALVIGVPGFDSGQLLFMLTFAAWLGQGVLRRQIVVPRTSLNPLLALFGLIGALSLLDAVSLSEGIVELIKWLEIAVMLWLVADLTGRYGYRPLLAGMLLAGAAQAVLGLWQFVLQPEGPEHFAIQGGRFFRAYGTFQQPNPFGAFMAWCAALGVGAVLGALSGWLQQGRPRPGLRTLLWWAFLAATTALALGGLLASWSRGAWLGFGAGMVVLVAFLPRRRVAGLLLFIAALGAAATAWQLGLLPASVTERLTGFVTDAPGALSTLTSVEVRGVDVTDANFAVVERLAHWQAALSMARQEPRLGVGFGNYEAAYPAYALLNWPAPLGHAHNYYLNLLAEVGFAGLAAYLLLWVAIFAATLRALRQPWPDRGVILGLLAVWVALSVHHLLDKLYVNNLYLHLGAMLGILVRLSLVRQRPEAGHVVEVTG